VGEVADTLNQAAEKLEPRGLKAGYHNHSTGIHPTDGARPMEILARTPTVGMPAARCRHLHRSRADPVAWIKANPGRIRSMHCQGLVAGSGEKKFSSLMAKVWRIGRRCFKRRKMAAGLRLPVRQEGSRFPGKLGRPAQKCLHDFAAHVRASAVPSSSGVLREAQFATSQLKHRRNNATIAAA